MLICNNVSHIKSTPAYTAGVFFVNMIKGIIVAALVGPPIVTAIIYLVPVRFYSLLRKLRHTNCIQNIGYC